MMDNNPSSSSPSSPLLLPPPNPPQPEQLETTNSNPPSPDVKPKLELIPTSTPDSNPNPNSNSNPKSPTKKTPPLPWTHQETISLIQTYQEKWYSLKKGQLKANQWEEVAATVAARCGHDIPSKTATQCRHKIEKLRKRYRAERLKAYPNSWQYFELMDHMERGPMPLTARPMSAVKYQNQKNASAAGGITGNYKESESDEGEANYDGLEFKKNKLKSINNIVRGSDVDVSSNNNRNVNKFGMSRNFGVGENVRFLRGMRTPVIQKRKGYVQNDASDEDEDDDDDDEGEELEEEEEEEEEEVEEKGGEVLGKELAAEIRGFAERFMRMENKKIEMIRETEKYRMEMEKKRMDMIIEAQRKVVDTIGRALGAHKKVKMAQEI